MRKAVFHLPGLFEFAEFYRVFLPIYREHPEFFYPWCEIGSLYGAPAACLWGGGRLGGGDTPPDRVLAMLEEYRISGRLTFSNSLLRQEHLADKTCNDLCALFSRATGVDCGVIVHADLLTEYLRQTYPRLYLVSSTTKVLTDRQALLQELARPEYRYVVPDFRWNRRFDLLQALPEEQKQKVELLCNECCYFGCRDRKACYESISRMQLGESDTPHQCTAPNACQGYLFSAAMQNPGFVGVQDIIETYLPMGIRHFKIEGRNLGTALVLELLLYYTVKPEFALRVRELTYLDSMLDLF